MTKSKSKIKNRDKNANQKNKIQEDASSSTPLSINTTTTQSSSTSLLSSSSFTTAAVSLSLYNNNINKSSTNSATVSTASTPKSIASNSKSKGIMLDLNNNDSTSINSSNSNKKKSRNSSNIITNSNNNNNNKTKTMKNSKSNRRFHQLFPSISLDESVLETYACAYVKSLNLYQGVMFVTENFICFYSKILNHENILILKFSHINLITKSMHALIFPTAIRIQTQNSIYSFTSFRSRSHTLKHLNRLLKQASKANNESERENQASLDETIEKSQHIQEEVEEEENCNNSDKCNHTTGNYDENKIQIAKENATTNTSKPTESSNRALKSLKANNLANLEAHSARKNDGDAKTNFFSMNDHNNYKYYNFMSITNPNLIYDFDYSNLSNNMVSISLKHRKTLLQKVKLLMGILIPGFFDISRIDALLPICFLMCFLLLLNAFVLLGKVNKIDDLFSELLRNEA